MDVMENLEILWELNTPLVYLNEKQLNLPGINTSATISEHWTCTGSDLLVASGDAAASISVTRWRHCPFWVRIFNSGDLGLGSDRPI